jgi:hypothetical protein
MAEVQRTTESGESTRLFIEFVMLQQQQTLLVLGKHPSAPPNAPPRNLALAKIFIDQLGMIRQKTSGNLNPAEEQVLGTALASLEAAYKEASQTRS